MASHTQWKNIRLGDVAKVISGFAFKSKDFQQEGIPIIKIKNIRVGAVDLSEIDHVDSSFLSLDTKYHVKGGDILISLTGSHLTQPNSVVGRIALHSSSLGHCLLNQRAGKIIITKPDICDKLFLFYSIYTEEKRREIALMALGAASQANVSPSQVETVEIKLPPLPIQRKIAAILSAYDRLIENNTRRIEILEEMARSLYREWFVKFRFPGHEQAQMVDSELGLIPEGWEVKKLGEIAQDIRRSVKPDQIDPQTPYFGLEHLPRKSIALSEWGTASQVQSTKLAFHKGEILFGKIRPYFHKVGVAPVEGICSSDAIVIKPKSPDYFPIVLACVSSEEFVAHATQTSQGTKMPRANWDVLIKYPVVIPPLPLLYKFNEFVQNTLAQIHNLIFKNRNLRQTRDLLLPRLISGEIDVENLDINTGPIAA